MPTGGGASGGGGGALAGKVFYHGTSNMAAQKIMDEGFNMKYSSTGADTIAGSGQPDVAKGVYLTSEPELAGTYASQMETGDSQELTPGKGTVLETQVNVKNVMGTEDFTKLLNEKMAEWKPGSQHSATELGLAPMADRLTEAAQAKGFDAIRTDMMYGGDELIVFDPKNVEVL